MTRIIVKKLIWDTRNTEHIKKHHVSSAEVEIAAQSMMTHKKAKLDRYIAIGRTGKRTLSVVIKRIETGIYYPVTARDASKKERRKIYEKEKV